MECLLFSATKVDKKTIIHNHLVLLFNETPKPNNKRAQLMSPLAAL